MSTAPDFWVKKVESTLDEMKVIPLWGLPPPFPWEKFSLKLSDALKLPKLALSLENTEWREKDSLLADMGKEPIVVSASLSPLPGKVYFALSQEDLARLTAYALSPQQENRGFSHFSFQEGFYRYLLLHILDTINQLDCFSSLLLKLEEGSALPQEGALCLDIKVKLNRKTLFGRIFVPRSLHEAFSTHFSKEKPPLKESALAQEIPVTLRATAGNVTLKVHEWQRVGLGDLLVLDRCTFDPETHKGAVSLVLDETALFQGRYKDEQIKILDYAITYEESMKESNPNEPNPEEMIPEQEFSEETAKEESEFSSTEGVNEESVEKLIASREIPMTLTVELCKLTLTLDKLLQLAPGNLLELPSRPEQGVSLCVHGKPVARGELVKIGEVIGVKISELG